MASSWGPSWGSAWGNSWGFVGAEGSFATPVIPNPNTESVQSQYLICDRSGWRVKPRTKGLEIEWTGNMVMEDWFEPRHDQDFLRAVPPDDHGGSPADEDDDTFVTANEIKDSDLPGG